MATALTDKTIDQIGDAAGLVWKTLSSEGAMSMAKLCRSIDAPRDLVMQAVGWLAREEKVCFQEGARGRLISLV